MAPLQKKQISDDKRSVEWCAGKADKSVFPGIENILYLLNKCTGI